MTQTSMQTRRRLIDGARCQEAVDCAAGSKPCHGEERAARQALAQPPSGHEPSQAPKLFGPIFSPPSWHNWETVVKAVDGEKLTDAETEFFKSISGGRSSNQPSQ
jgi:hypothetical protein